MADVSIQLVILKRLTAHLAGMTVLGGYGFDLAGRVFRGRTQFGDETPLPCLTVLESPQNTEGNPGDYARLIRNTRWTIFIQGFVADDKDNPTDPAYELKAHVERRLAEIVEQRNGRPAHPALYRLGGLIAELEIGNGVVRPPQRELSDKAFFWLPVVITYSSNAARPLMAVADPDNP